MAGACGLSPSTATSGNSLTPAENDDGGIQTNPEVDSDSGHDRDLPPIPDQPSSSVTSDDECKVKCDIDNVEPLSEPKSTMAPNLVKENSISPAEPPCKPPRTKKRSLSTQQPEVNDNKILEKNAIKSLPQNQKDPDDKPPKNLDDKPEKDKVVDMSGEKDSGVKLRKELGLVDCVGLIVGNIIGSGIFVSPGGVLHYSGSVGMSLAVWVASGFVSMVGALCYAEMGAMIPQSGAEYTYLHEAFGPLPAFLQVWISVMIGIPGNRAIGSLTFANYVLQPFFPSCQGPPDSALRIVGALLIVTLTYINSRKVKWATTVQDVLALTKVLALIMIIVVGINHLARGRSDNFADPMANTNWNPAFIATANMPRAIAISLCSVMVIYILTNVAYFAVLTPHEILSSTAVAVVFGNLTLGVMAWTIPIFVACSTGGGLNGSIFASSRLLFVSSRRGHLPRALSFVHTEHYTPVIALVFSACISMLMYVTSDVRVLINYLSFAHNLLGLGCIAAFFWFRIKQPDRPRPIKVWIGFPIVFFFISLFLTVFPIIRQPLEVLVALVVFGTGIVVYYLAIYREKKPKRLMRTMDKLTYVCQMLFLVVPEEKTNTASRFTEEQENDCGTLK
ncbi:Large neutral amino acids transporter small subunit 2-like [Homarus americanus]|uniref:Large neutral amino acids transporter small subunit 2-like n=1 Tax=Homarus americanus TaxID=6706 RepID=A0A8J5MZB8_HOMAM|nr:Large neutral amino acids transporter small subunit 2-like [Homarus americanus]